jgi:UDP-glucose 4-epimerase
MRSVAVTGAAGYLGRRLLQRLQADPAVAHILALDVAPLAESDSRVSWVTHDVSRPLQSLFSEHDVDTVVHLAFVVDPIHDRRRMRQVNVGGTTNVLHAAAAAGVQTMLLTSSGTAYGALPDNPPQLTEDHPLRGRPGFPYVEDKLVQEQLARRFQEEQPDCRVLVVRPSVVVGAHIDNFISRFYRKAIAIAVRGYDPLIPLVHEEDVAEAIWHLLQQAPAGAYNLDGADPPRLSTAVARLGGRRLPLPAGLLYPAAALAWRLRLRAITEAPPAMLDYIRYSWVLDGTRVTRATAFTYRFTAPESLAAMATARTST